MGLGAKVDSLRKLNEAALDRRAVIVPESTGFGKPRAAAFVISLPGRVINNLLSMGMFIYEKEKE